MKQGHMGIHIVVPLDNVHALARLDGGNRTKSVNKAIQLYIDVQGPDKNRYGVDCHYFREKLLQLVSRLDSYTEYELRRAFLQLEGAVRGEDPFVEMREAINEEV